MERTLESLESIIDQLSERICEINGEKQELIDENNELYSAKQALEADNKELRRQLVSMRAA